MGCPYTLPTLPSMVLADPLWWYYRRWCFKAAALSLSSLRCCWFQQLCVFVVYTSCSYRVTLSHTHTLTHTLSLSHTHTHTHTHTYSLTHHTHSLSHTHTPHTLSHTHILSFSHCLISLVAVFHKHCLHTAKSAVITCTQTVQRILNVCVNN